MCSTIQESKHILFDQPAKYVLCLASCGAIMGIAIEYAEERVVMQSPFCLATAILASIAGLTLSYFSAWEKNRNAHICQFGLLNELNFDNKTGTTFLQVY